jgi:hypothetical protein
LGEVCRVGRAGITCGRRERHGGFDFCDKRLRWAAVCPFEFHHGHIDDSHATTGRGERESWQRIDGRTAAIGPDRLIVKAGVWKGSRRPATHRQVPELRQFLRILVKT